MARSKPDPTEYDAALDAVEVPDPVSPCPGCRHLARCEAEHLACDAKAIFAAGLPEFRYRLAPRLPTRARWELMQLPRKPKPKPRRIALPASQD